MRHHLENAALLECVWLACDLGGEKKTKQKQTKKTVPVNKLVLTGPSTASILINSQWVLGQHKSWSVWQYICCSVTCAFPVRRQMESTCSSVWHNGWWHQKHLIPHPLLVFYFTAITQHAHNVASHYAATIEVVSECQSEENEGV